MKWQQQLFVVSLEYGQLLQKIIHSLLQYTTGVVFFCALSISAGKMPSLVKIFVECGRDLPVMDRNTVSAESSTGRTKQT